MLQMLVPVGYVLYIIYVCKVFNFPGFLRSVGTLICCVSSKKYNIRGAATSYFPGSRVMAQARHSFDFFAQPATFRDDYDS